MFRPGGAAAENGTVSRPIVALVGRPNAGKSTRFNRLIGWRKAIVDRQPGLTRDRLYGVAEWRSREMSVVDTAGLELSPEASSASAIEAQTRVAIEEAQVIVLLLDIREGVTAIDRDIASMLRRSGRPVVVAANKADDPRQGYLQHEILELGFPEVVRLSGQHGIGVDDLLDAILTGLPPAEEIEAGEEAAARIAIMDRPERRANYWSNQLRSEFRFVPHAPVVTISALTGEGVAKVLPAALEVVGRRHLRVPTNELNRVLREAFLRRPPPSFHGKRLNLKYATQAASETPTFVLFVNDVNLLHFSYRRYLENRLRERFGFAGNPIRIALRSSEAQD